MPVRVAQEGRSVLSIGASVGVEIAFAILDLATSFGGQVRLKPPLTLRVGWPQDAQNGFRAFQSSI